MRLAVALIVSTASLWLLTGCGLHAVRPYERAQLATPAMQMHRDGVLERQREDAARMHEALRNGQTDAVVGTR